MSKDRADSLRPILRWVKEAAPRQRERKQAAGILREIEGIKDWKQIVLTRGEAELLGFIVKEFPEGGAVERQLPLFDLRERGEVVLGTIERRRTGTSPSGEEVELPTPMKSLNPDPVLKTELTPGEQAERESTVSKPRYEPKSEAYWNARMGEKG